MCWGGWGEEGESPPRWQAHPLAKALVAAPAGAGEPLLAAVTRLLAFSPLGQASGSGVTGGRDGLAVPSRQLDFDAALQWLKPFLCFALLSGWDSGMAPVSSYVPPSLAPSVPLPLSLSLERANCQ
jgi:hypothetical protein